MKLQYLFSVVLTILLTQCGIPDLTPEANDASEKQIDTSLYEPRDKPDFYLLGDSNQTTIVYAPKYNKIWFDTLDKKFPKNKPETYEDRYTQYMYDLFDTLPKLAEGSTKGDRDFYNRLTRGQKIFYTLLVFEGEVDNGGVTQFFFNRPEFAFAALEAFKELNIEPLAKDYEVCLNQFTGSQESFAKRKSIFNNESVSWEKRWKSFTIGESDIPAASDVQSYFYDKEFKQKFYITAMNYIDKNIDQFTKK